MTGVVHLPHLRCHLVGYDSVARLDSLLEEDGRHSLPVKAEFSPKAIRRCTALVRLHKSVLGLLVDDLPTASKDGLVADDGGQTCEPVEHPGNIPSV